MFLEDPEIVFREGLLFATAGTTESMVEYICSADSDWWLESTSIESPMHDIMNEPRNFGINSIATTASAKNLLPPTETASGHEIPQGAVWSCRCSRPDQHPWTDIAGDGHARGRRASLEYKTFAAFLAGLKTPLPGFAFCFPVNLSFQTLHIPVLLSSLRSAVDRDPLR